MEQKLSINEYRELKGLRALCKEQELEISLLRRKIKSLEERLEGTELIIPEQEEVSLEEPIKAQKVIIERSFDGAKFVATIEDDFLICKTENLNVLNREKWLEHLGYKIVSYD